MLVMFDLKAAFNSVNKVSLDARLQDKGIPMKATAIGHTLPRVQGYIAATKLR
jgi:hypothetical protein